MSDQKDSTADGNSDYAKELLQGFFSKNRTHIEFDLFCRANNITTEAALALFPDATAKVLAKKIDEERAALLAEKGRLQQLQSDHYDAREKEILWTDAENDAEGEMWSAIDTRVQFISNLLDGITPDNIFPDSAQSEAATNAELNRIAATYLEGISEVVRDDPTPFVAFISSLQQNTQAPGITSLTEPAPDPAQVQPISPADKEKLAYLNTWYSRIYNAVSDMKTSGYSQIDLDVCNDLLSMIARQSHRLEKGHIDSLLTPQELIKRVLKRVSDRTDDSSPLNHAIIDAVRFVVSDAEQWLSRIEGQEKIAAAGKPEQQPAAVQPRFPSVDEQLDYLITWWDKLHDASDALKGYKDKELVKEDFNFVLGLRTLLSHQTTAIDDNNAPRPPEDVIRDVLKLIKARAANKNLPMHKALRQALSFVVKDAQQTLKKILDQEKPTVEAPTAEPVKEPVKEPDEEQKPLQPVRPVDPGFVRGQDDQPRYPHTAEQEEALIEDMARNGEDTFLLDGYGYLSRAFKGGYKPAYIEQLREIINNRLAFKKTYENVSQTDEPFDAAKLVAEKKTFLEGAPYADSAVHTLEALLDSARASFKNYTISGEHIVIINEAIAQVSARLNKARAMAAAGIEAVEKKGGLFKYLMSTSAPRALLNMGVSFGTGFVAKGIIGMLATWTLGADVVTDPAIATALVLGSSAVAGLATTVAANKVSGQKTTGQSLLIGGCIGMLTGLVGLQTSKINSFLHNAPISNAFYNAAHYAVSIASSVAVSAGLGVYSLRKATMSTREKVKALTGRLLLSVLTSAAGAAYYDHAYAQGFSPVDHDGNGLDQGTTTPDTSHDQTSDHPKGNQHPEQGGRDEPVNHHKPAKLWQEGNAGKSQSFFDKLFDSSSGEALAYDSAPLAPTDHLEVQRPEGGSGGPTKIILPDGKPLTIPAGNDVSGQNPIDRTITITGADPENPGEIATQVLHPDGKIVQHYADGTEEVVREASVKLTPAQNVQPQASEPTDAAQQQQQSGAPKEAPVVYDSIDDAIDDNPPLDAEEQPPVITPGTVHFLNGGSVTTMADGTTITVDPTRHNFEIDRHDGSPIKISHTTAKIVDVDMATGNRTVEFKDGSQGTYTLKGLLVTETPAPKVEAPPVVDPPAIQFAMGADGQRIHTFPDGSTLEIKNIGENLYHIRTTDSAGNEVENFGTDRQLAHLGPKDTYTLIDNNDVRTVYSLKDGSTIEVIPAPQDQAQAPAAETGTGRTQQHHAQEPQSPAHEQHQTQGRKTAVHAQQDVAPAPQEPVTRTLPSGITETKVTNPDGSTTFTWSDGTDATVKNGKLIGGNPIPAADTSAGTGSEAQEAATAKEPIVTEIDGKTLVEWTDEAGKKDGTWAVINGTEVKGNLKPFDATLDTGSEAAAAAPALSEQPAKAAELDGKNTAHQQETNSRPAEKAAVPQEPAPERQPIGHKVTKLPNGNVRHDFDDNTFVIQNNKGQIIDTNIGRSTASPAPVETPQAATVDPQGTETNRNRLSVDTVKTEKTTYVNVSMPLSDGERLVSGWHESDTNGTADIRPDANAGDPKSPVIKDVDNETGEARQPTKPRINGANIVSFSLGG